MLNDHVKLMKNKYDNDHVFVYKQSLLLINTVQNRIHYYYIENLFTFDIEIKFDIKAKNRM